MSTSTRAIKLKEKTSFLAIQRNIFLWIALVVLLIGAASSIYYELIYQPNQFASQTPVIQTATVRQGNIIISASGTGTLIATEEKQLGFTAGGKVTKLFVNAGDQVKIGELLAEVASPNAQVHYAEAKNKYRELTSPAAIASAQLAAAQAQTNLQNTVYYLGYLISPDVLYWETEISKAEQSLKETRTRAENSPTDENVQKNFKAAEAYLGFAQDKLSDAHVLYTDEYVLENFVISRGGRRYLALPTELQIIQARTAIDEARNQLKESKELYAVLMGDAMPENTSNAALIELQQAERELQNAKTVLDGTRILAPISGTIIEVNTSVGNTVGTDGVIVIADLSQLNLEIYLDTADWGKAVIGNQVEVTFDILPDQVFTGQLTKVDRQLYTSSNSSAVKGVVSLTEPFSEINLPIGASASVDVISAQVKNALLIPVEALHEISPGKYTVYIVEDNQPKLRMIEVGLQNEVYAEVKSGLDVGEVIAIGAVKVE